MLFISNFILFFISPLLVVGLVIVLLEEVIFSREILAVGSVYTELLSLLLLSLELFIVTSRLSLYTAKFLALSNAALATLVLYHKGIFIFWLRE